MTTLALSRPAQFNASSQPHLPNIHHIIGFGSTTLQCRWMHFGLARNANGTPSAHESTTMKNVLFSLTISLLVVSNLICKFIHPNNAITKPGEMS